MKTTTLALAAATLLGGFALGAGPASAEGAAGLRVGGAPTGYVMMSSRKKMMMMKRKRMMMHKRMMMKKKMM